MEKQVRLGDSLRESNLPLTTTVIDKSGGTYPTEEWEATYFSTSHRGALTAHRVTVRMPAGLAEVCPPVRIGQPGCVYAVRRWGFALRPSVLEAAGFDPTPFLTAEDDASLVRVMLHAASFELPGEFVIASPEHPFRLVGPDGLLRGSSMSWRTYLGALSFFVSEGRVDASFLRLWAEAPESYDQAVDICLTALRNAGRVSWRID
ncbi:MAG: hypothetical protein ACUVWZ_09120 [Anaerolineae bacterium]